MFNLYQSFRALLCWFLVWLFFVLFLFLFLFLEFLLSAFMSLPFLQITFDYSYTGNFCHNCCNLTGFSFFFLIKVINDDAFKIIFHSSSS